MFQPTLGTQSFQITTMDTTATQFTARPAGIVSIQADPDNTGKIMILGVKGGTIESAGPRLAAGEFLPTLMLNDMSQIAYKAETSGDKINVFVAK